MADAVALACDVLEDGGAHDALPDADRQPLTDLRAEKDEPGGATEPSAISDEEGSPASKDGRTSVMAAWRRPISARQDAWTSRSPRWTARRRTWLMQRAARKKVNEA